MTHKIPETYAGQDVAFCGKCKKWKLKQDFHKNSKNKTGVHGHCKLCQKEWRDKNSERMIQNAMEWQRNNPEKAAASIKKWNKKNPDKIKNYQKNNDKQKQQRRNSDPVLLEKRREQNRIAARKSRIKLHPGYDSVKANKRRTRIQDGKGTYTQNEWLALCEQYGNICLCCKEKKPLTIDHVVPLSSGGSNSIDNLQPLCRQCNSKKNTKTIDFR